MLHCASCALMRIQRRFSGLLTFVDLAFVSKAFSNCEAICLGKLQLCFNLPDSLGDVHFLFVASELHSLPSEGLESRKSDSLSLVVGCTVKNDSNTLLYIISISLKYTCDTTVYTPWAHLCISCARGRYTHGMFTSV